MSTKDSIQFIVLEPGYGGTNAIDTSSMRRSVLECANAISDDVSIRDSQIGLGADLPVWVIYLGGAGVSTFLLGKKIEESIDGWISLHRRFVLMVNRMREKFGVIAVDETAATAIATDAIISAGALSVESLRVIAEGNVRYNEREFLDELGLDHHPECVYVRVYVDDSMMCQVVVVDESGDVVHVSMPRPLIR